MVIVQIEGKRGVAEIDRILDVAGIDVAFIGPYDLSQSLGIPGKIDHPSVYEKMKEIIDCAKKRRIAVGTFVDNMDGFVHWKKCGVQYLSYSVDVGIFYERCKEIVTRTRT